MERLQKIYLVFSLIGILLLLFLSSFINPKEISICDVNKTADNEKITVRGMIIDEKILAENFKLLVIKNNDCKIDVVCNCKTTLFNNNVLVTGRIQMYNNKKQISADKIGVLNND